MTARILDRAHWLQLVLFAHGVKPICQRASGRFGLIRGLSDIAGGHWPELARKAAVALSADTDDNYSFTTKLLRALK